MASVADLLERVSKGDRAATAELLPLLYDQLRKLAQAKLQNERPGHTLQATALVHEAYLRLIDGETSTEELWDGEPHFLAAAAEAMRRILVDHARYKKRLKRGGDLKKFSLSGLGDEIPQLDPPENLLDLDRALTRLQGVDPIAAELVHLRYFAGLTIAQAAAAMGISERAANRLWAYAKAWLFQELQSA